jgi:hypothetical protein
MQQISAHDRSCRDEANLELVLLAEERTRFAGGRTR